MSSQMHLLEESDKQEGAILFHHLLFFPFCLRILELSLHPFPFLRELSNLSGKCIFTWNTGKGATLETFKNAFFRENRKIDTDTYFFLSIVCFKVLSFTKVSLCWWRDYSGRNSFVVSLSAGTMKLVWTLILLYVNKSFNDNPKQKFYSDDGDFIPMWSNNFEMQKGIQMKTFLSSCSLIKKSEPTRYQSGLELTENWLKPGWDKVIWG